MFQINYKLLFGLTALAFFAMSLQARRERLTKEMYASILASHMQHCQEQHE